MKINSSLKPDLDAEPALAPPLQIVVISDHPTASANAGKLMNEFIRKWASNVEAHRDDWSFAELEHPEFRRESFELAHHCDLLILALDGPEDLPETFLDWLRDWRHSRASDDETFILCASAIAPSVLPIFASLPSILCGDGLTCFTTSISSRDSRPPAPFHPEPLLARLAMIDRTNLPENSVLND